MCQLALPEGQRSSPPTETRHRDARTTEVNVEQRHLGVSGKSLLRQDDSAFGIELFDVVGGEFRVGCDQN